MLANLLATAAAMDMPASVVVGFADDVVTYLWPTPKRKIKGGIAGVVAKCHVRGMTALYDGIDHCISMVRFQGRHVQIVALTDGQDNASQGQLHGGRGWDEMLRQLSAASALTPPGAGERHRRRGEV